MMKKIFLKLNMAVILAVILFANLTSVYADNTNDKEIIEKIFEASIWENDTYRELFSGGNRSYFYMKIKNEELTKLSSQYNAQINVEDGAILIDDRRYDIATGYDNNYYLADSDDVIKGLNDGGLLNEEIKRDDNYRYVNFISSAIEEYGLLEGLDHESYWNGNTPDRFNLNVAVASDNDELIRSADFSILKTDNTSSYASSDNPQPFLKIVKDSGAIKAQQYTGKTSVIEQEFEEKTVSLETGESKEIGITEDKEISTDTREISFSVANDGYYKMMVLDEDGQKVQMAESTESYADALKKYELGQTFIKTDDVEGILEHAYENVSYSYLRKNIEYHFTVSSKGNYRLAIEKIRRW